jgi:hypothetical protein
VRDPRDILAALVVADEAAPEQQTFILVYAGVGREIIAIGWTTDLLNPAPSAEEIDDLAERDWVRVTDVDGQGRSFAVTVAGRNAAKARARQLSAAAASAVVLDWAAVTPVLDSLWGAYVVAGAPEHGVETEPVLRDLDEPTAGRAAVRELVRGGFLEALLDVEQADVPSAVRPTPLTLQLFAGWPGSASEAILDQLIAAMSEAIDSTSDEDKRTALVRVREGLLGAARDTALAYFDKKVVGLWSTRPRRPWRRDEDSQRTGGPLPLRPLGAEHSARRGLCAG